MNRYGDTPLGMVESALEFAPHRARMLSQFQVLDEVEQSQVMIECYRLPVARLDQEGRIQIIPPPWRDGSGREMAASRRHRHWPCRATGGRRFGCRYGGFAARIEVCKDLLEQIPTLTNHESQCESRVPSTPSLSRAAPPEIELSESAQCGGEQLIRVVVTCATFDKVRRRFGRKTT
jgi:(E)-4-hydroxy-3-methylbut-2-enyl-diphosphate synthase